MPSLAITGTIGSGKSSVLNSLGRLLGAEMFSADEENRNLLDHDAEIKNQIIALLGKSCYRSDGRADRKTISDLIRTYAERRIALEGVLHPRLEKLWKPRAEHFHTRKNIFFIAEIPLLFEKKLELFFDKSIVVECSQCIRRKRLIELRSLTPIEAEAWSAMQEPQEVKVTKADHILWNDGSLNMLQQQIHLLASQLRQP